jgi:hypothetical protein
VTAFGLALAGAWGIAAIHRTGAENPEWAVAATAAAFGLVGVLALLACAVARRNLLSPGELSLAALTIVSIMLAAIYFFWASAGIFQVADILMWAESPYVNDIIKWRTGTPLYSPPADFDSFYYTPGSQLLTYAIASLVGAPTSIPAYRLIQVGYVITAALVTLVATRRLIGLVASTPREEPTAIWGALLAMLAFLAAGNSITSEFAHLLHNDALSLLVCAVAFHLLVTYAESHRISTLAALALVPAAGFLVKQSLLIWGVLIVGYLLFFDRPRRPRQIVLFSLAAFGLVAGVYGAGWLIWDHAFDYWVITGLGSRPVSLLRGIEHGLVSWAYFAAGLAGGMVIFRALPDIRVLGLWIVWLLLLGTETYTSGIAWTLNHMGPGSMLAMPWLGVALLAVWPAAAPADWKTFAWLRSAAACAGTVLLLNGLGMVRIPVPSVPQDIERYVRAIESEVQGYDLSRVLIDHGSWLYLPAGIVMKDRSAAISEAGYSATGDFSGFLERIRTLYYVRILVHDFDGPGFRYDHYSWQTSSGIHQALDKHYEVVRTIPGVKGLRAVRFSTISVLEPRRTEAAREGDGAGR